MRRVAGLAPPWSDDPVLSAHRFTNVYRAADRVSQYLIRNVLYDGPQDAEEVFFRALLFKLFNRIETWEQLTARPGTLTWKTLDVTRVSSIRCSLSGRGCIRAHTSCPHQRSAASESTVITFACSNHDARWSAPANYAR